MTIKEIIKELKLKLPVENFKIQPEASLNEIISLEGKYNVNTVDFLKGDYECVISKNDIEKWLNLYSTFKNFNGDDDKLNSIR